MTNKNYVERFEQAGGIIINKMFWIAGSFESSEFKDMLTDDMSIREWTEMLPEIDVKQLEEYIDEDNAMQIFADYSKFGFIAETHYPEHYNFSYKAGKIIGCSVSNGSCSIDYVYGETIEELMKKIEVVAEENYQRCLLKDKKKAKSKV